MTKAQTMILYRNLRFQSLFDGMENLLLREQNLGNFLEEESERPDAGQLAGDLIEFAVQYGFSGNIWHDFLAFCLADSENAYSVSSEIRGEIPGTLNRIADRDFMRIRRLFAVDIAELDSDGGSLWAGLKNYEGPGTVTGILSSRIRERIETLAEELRDAADEEAFRRAVTRFYGEYGVGKFGLHRAFRVLLPEEIHGGEGAVPGHTVRIDPISSLQDITLDDLVGYELQKQKLIENTEAFLEGRAANNVLLYGSSGTGKSSSVKAILNRYYGRGLRMIEIYKHQFRGISDVLEQIRDRNYKFILYMDDLSFEDYEVEYKYLKAIIEGGLGIRPDNVLIYATSNRRHLIREKFSDKRELDDDLHTTDTVQEKLSLVSRFGVTIFFGSPDKREYGEIVKTLADRAGIHIPEEELYLEANKWELRHGGLSGRTAAQFITWLAGTREESIAEEEEEN